MLARSEDCDPNFSFLLHSDREIINPKKLPTQNNFLTPYQTSFTVILLHRNVATNKLNFIYFTIITLTGFGIKIMPGRKHGRH